ncbi:DUF1491 family protein [Sphingomonas oligophenolica]|uniref:DUF1491 family protein n=1 Tax=Sphingomonas oligophenolica TaxID=301154 RepID=A0A502CUU9_9SPHN|nr:DUF1491 family protein [Sphingomonas oligophenolica]TPG15596.1 DUF1491 family protein [Sphingomonas oligophenolica]
MTLPSGILVSAMIRRANDSGGFGFVLAKGQPQAGAILLVVSTAGTDYRVLERGIGPDGRVALIDSTPADDVTGYWRRRRSSDPDLWVIELTSPDAERFAAETILDD